jgi:hypothetical protein
MFHSSLRTALAVAACLALSIPLEAQPRRRPPVSYVQPEPPDQAEGARILEQSRNIGLAGPYYLEFELRILPRAGAERRLQGRWFGTHAAAGPVTRIELAPQGAPAETWLVQSGFKPRVWRAVDGGDFQLVSGAEAALPLVGTTLSAADLQTPFMYWTEFVYEGLERFRGRPTHVFLLMPPDAQAERLADVGGARVFIDTAYSALSQAQWVDAEGKALKTITILNLKEIDQRWIVKSFEARDERTRDKTRFVVTAAALDLALPVGLFSPDGSGRAAELVLPPGALVPVR